MQVGFPQKSVFATITANQVNTPILNSPDADLQIQRGGAIGILVDTAKVRFDKHLRLNTDVEVQDVSGSALIAGDNSGNIDQLGSPDDMLLISVCAAESYTGYTDAVVTPKLYGDLEISANGQANFAMTLPSRLLGIDLEIASIKISFYTAHANAYITASVADLDPIPHATRTNLFTDMVDKENGTTGEAEFTWSTLTDHNLNDVPILTIAIQCIATDGIVKIHGFEILLKQHD